MLPYSLFFTDEIALRYIQLFVLKRILCDVLSPNESSRLRTQLEDVTESSNNDHTLSTSKAWYISSFYSPVW